MLRLFSFYPKGDTDIRLPFYPWYVFDVSRVKERRNTHKVEIKKMRHLTHFSTKCHTNNAES